MLRDVKQRPIINASNIAAFRCEYNRACDADEYSFKFEGAEVLTAYAKYIFMYWDTLRT